MQSENSQPSEKNEFPELGSIKAGLYDRIGSDDLIPYAVQSFRTHFQAEFSGFSIHGPNLSIHRVANDPPSTELQISLVPKINEYLHEHPAFTYIKEHSHDLIVVKITDFTSTESFKKTNLYQQAYGPAGFDHVLSAGATDRAGSYYALNLMHSKCDFTEKQKKQLRILYPSFLKAYMLNNLLNKRFNEIKSILKITRREKEVLEWIGAGKTNREIGEKLGISPRTVEKHTDNISRKLGFDNRIALVKYSNSSKSIRFPVLDELTTKV